MTQKIQIEVTLFGFLKKYSPQDKSSFEMTVAPDTTLGNVAHILGIPPGESRMNLLNGHHAKDDAGLSTGDEVVFLTPVEGG